MVAAYGRGREAPPGTDGRFVHRSWATPGLGAGRREPLPPAQNQWIHGWLWRQITAETFPMMFAAGTVPQ